MTDEPGPDETAAPGPAETGPLAGRTVLVPRSLDRALGLAARLHADGAEVLVAPVIDRAPADDLDALDDAARDLAAGRYAWVLVTSVNAVDELAAAVTRTTPDAGLGDAPVRWAAVGPSTARALRAVGVEPDLVPADASALGLLAALRDVVLDATPDSTTPDGPGSTAPEILLPLGDLARPTLERGLTALGARPHVVTAYRTVTHAIDADVRAAWDAGRVDAVVLTSGSVAREVAAQLGPREGVVAVAIGSPTRTAATEVGLAVGATATTPDDAGLAAAVRAALAPSGTDLPDRPSDRSPEEDS